MTKLDFQIKKKYELIPYYLPPSIVSYQQVKYTYLFTKWYLHPFPLK